MAQDVELIEALRRQSAQMGKLATAMDSLTAGLRLQAEAVQALAAAIAKLAEEDQIEQAGSESGGAAGSSKPGYLDERPGGTD